MRIAIGAIGLLIMCAGGAVAAFNDIGVGGRPLGMGGAFVALADDGNAASYNPAGLGYINAASSQSNDSATVQRAYQL